MRIFTGKMRRTSSKPTTKKSYVMPRTQVQNPNRFEVLGKIPKPSFPSSSIPIYHIKEAKLLIQILEADHVFALGDFDYHFKSNDVPKTRIFYRFIIIDTEFV